MQCQARALGLERDQMRGELRTANQVIHATLRDLDVSAFGIELHVRARIVLRKRAAVSNKIHANLPGSTHAHDGVHGARVITHFGSSARSFRRYTIVFYLPFADQFHATIWRRVWRHELHGLAGVVPIHVFNRASAVNFADVSFLGCIAAFRTKLVFGRIQRHLHHLGMRLRHEFANLSFHLQVVTFAEDLHHDLALRIDEEAVRPAIGLVRLPRCALLVSDNEPWKLEALRGLFDVIHIKADVEFTVMNADYVEAVGVILGVPALHDREVADAVDAGVLPEIDENDFAAIVGDVMGSGGTGIEPDDAFAEIRRGIHFEIDLSDSRQNEAEQQQQRGEVFHVDRTVDAAAGLSLRSHALSTFRNEHRQAK